MESTNKFDREVFKFHNKMRTNPQSFIPHLEEMLTRFDGNLLKKGPGQSYNLRTKEGPAAVREAIKYLKKIKPVPELEWQQEMQAASRDHVLDTGPKGKIGHNGTNGSTPKKRCEKYVKFEGNSGENIDYGTKGPMDVIVALCIDDGVPSRGHRHNIFNRGFKKMACFTGSHKTYGSQTVINYNGSAAEMNDFMK